MIIYIENGFYFYGAFILKKIGMKLCHRKIRLSEVRSY